MENWRRHYAMVLSAGQQRMLAWGADKERGGIPFQREESRRSLDRFTREAGVPLEEWTGLLRIRRRDVV